LRDFVKINQNIEIEIEKGFDYSGRYKTRVEDVNEQGMIIGMPISKGNLVPLRPGTEVIVWQWDNSASYAHFCKVRERIFEPIPLVYLDWPFRSEKIQRRSFVRVPANLKIEYVLNVKKPDLVHQTSYIRDLSGGGTQFASQVQFKKGDILKIKLHLPDSVISSKAKVVWAYDDVYDKITRHLVGIEFYEIPEKLRDKIIKYVFIRQRELIKKGVL